MQEYLKINNIFKFDEKYRNIVGMTDTYEALKNITWQGTEKVDGTNIRVYWDGHRISLAGRTEKAMIPSDLENYLSSLFLTQEMEYVFEQMFGEKEVILFGEGYGPKIQNGGDYSPSASFILFDILIGNSYLSRDNVNQIADRLGLKAVPIVFEGNLNEAIKFVAEHHMSTLGNGKHEMEGLVLEPKGVRLYDYNFKPVKCKCKYRDIMKAKEIPGRF